MPIDNADRKVNQIVTVIGEKYKNKQKIFFCDCVNLWFRLTSKTGCGSTASVPHLRKNIVKKSYCIDGDVEYVEQINISVNNLALINCFFIYCVNMKIRSRNVCIQSYSKSDVSDSNLACHWY